MVSAAQSPVGDGISLLSKGVWQTPLPDLGCFYSSTWFLPRSQEALGALVLCAELRLLCSAACPGPWTGMLGCGALGAPFCSKRLELLLCHPADGVTSEQLWSEHGREPLSLPRKENCEQARGSLAQKVYKTVKLMEKA